MPLRDLVKPRREAVSVAGAFGDWSPITVHLDGAISVRNRSVPYKGAMFAAYPGDVVFSKIDARNGAIGVVPPTIAKAVVTPEFPVFVADPAKLNGAFLQRVLRSGSFLAALRSKASGTSGRKRITPEAFLDLRIPLPTLAEQKAIIRAYDGAMKGAAAQEEAAGMAEAEATAGFEAALGFAPPTALPDRPVFVARFQDLDRWSHEGALRYMASSAAAATAWPIVCLKDVVADLENGWSPNCLDRPAEIGEWGVLKLGAVSFGVYDEMQNKALPSRLKPRPFLEIVPGQVLISRANVSRLVGATTLVAGTRPKLLLCDKIFRIVWRSTSIVTAEFVTEALRISSVRRQIEAKLTGTSPTMKNISKPSLLSLTFPLPPLNDQRNLIAALDAGRAKAAQLRTNAAAVRAAAWTAFEAAVYAAPPPSTDLHPAQP